MSGFDLVSCGAVPMGNWRGNTHIFSENGHKMSLDHKTTTSGAASGDFEAVSQQLAALREDMSRLAETVTGIAGRRRDHLVSDIAEGFDEAKNYAASTGKSAEHQLEVSVAAHPLLAVGLAAGAGLLVGAMSRR